MSAWISVFCKQCLAQVTQADLVRVLTSMEDPYIDAEAYGIEDEAIVDAALAQLRIEPTGASGFSKLRLYYRAPELRPVNIDRIANPTEIHEMVQEELDEWLTIASGPGPDLIRAQLLQAQEIISFELGWLQLEDMGVVFAYEAARWLAEMGDGCMKDHNAVWWNSKEGMWNQVHPIEQPPA